MEHPTERTCICIPELHKIQGQGCDQVKIPAERSKVVALLLFTFVCMSIVATVLLGLFTVCCSSSLFSVPQEGCAS